MEVDLGVRRTTSPPDFPHHRLLTPAEGAATLATRQPSIKLTPDADLPKDTLLWALLQHLSGGTWGGCVYDADALAKLCANRVA